jgi:UPF0271 protein
MNYPTLNCDLGESFGAWQMGYDAEIIPLIDSANIACGFHGGDPVVILQTLQLAREHGKEIGAHVSYPDLMGFGRRSMQLSKNELRSCILYQLAALHGLARTVGCHMSYIKPHGALYNDMMQNDALLEGIMASVSAWPDPLELVILATDQAPAHRAMAARYQLSLRFEAFADRAYTPSGMLVPRGQAGAVLSAAEAQRQVSGLIEGYVTTISGERLPLIADTLCVHGDTESALDIVRHIRQRWPINGTN